MDLNSLFVIFEHKFEVSVGLLAVIAYCAFLKCSDTKKPPKTKTVGNLRDTTDSAEAKDAADNTDEGAVDNSTLVPLSVNYHFTRKCNYSCGFCFHTAKTSFHLPLDEAKKGLLMLKDAGMKKVNFSGGEPFIVNRGTHLGEMVRYCKESLELESVSVVSNGSLITERWMEQYGDYLDILAVSCDSFDEETNRKIGRHQKGKDHIKCLKNVRKWCDTYHVAFKINTVVNTHNYQEDMSENIHLLNPVRWKVFQCLLIGGENSGEQALRNAESFVISDQNFDEFCRIHSDVECLVPESNEKMRNSYLILDEYMRFLDCRKGDKKPSKSLL